MAILLKCSVTGGGYQEGSFSDHVHKYINSKSIDELNSNLEFIARTNEPEFSLWFEGLVWELSIHTKQIAEDIYSSSESSEESIEYSCVYQMWDKIGSFMLSDPQKYCQQLLYFYKEFLKVVRYLQRPEGKNKFVRLHKGGIYHNIALSLLFTGNNDEVKNYFILGVIEDILKERLAKGAKFRECPGYMNLRNMKVFVGENDKDEIELERLVVKAVTDGEDFELANPELIFLNFIKTKSSRLKLSEVILWDNSLMKRLIQEVEESETTKKLGKIMELLTCYLFLTSGNFSVTRNKFTLHTEHDIIVRNLIKNDPILELLGRYILVECKNTINKVDSTKMKKFIANIRLARCDTGIIFSKNGMTGVRSKDSAWYVSRIEYHKDGVVALVVTLEDINKLANEEISFTEQIKEKYEEIRFDGK